VAEIHLDHEVLSALREVMEDEYPLLVDTFLADSEERLRLLHKASDACQFIIAAHSFKGSSSNMGAIHLAKLCHQLEQRAQQPSLEGIEKLVAAIDEEFAIVRPLFKEERQRFHY
jgi:HPt (histidine-containing phosphotransfer) domain-containing protein